MSKYQLYCCGSRGSRPVEGKKFNEFGGFTSCYVLKTDDYALIIDCGTGLYEANNIILDCSTIDIVLTHIHYDHILGMLDWDAFNQKSKITFYGGIYKWFGQKTLDEFFREPFWPVQPSFVLKDAPPTGTRLNLRDDLSVEFFKSPHPNDAQRIMIRVTDENSQEHSIAIMFDNETPDGIEKSILQNCDYMIYDGMYTDSEYPRKKGFGHSTWQEACRFAVKVNCKRLIVTHHDPFRTDDELRRFERLARDIYPATDFARSGQHWNFPYEEDKKELEKKKSKSRFNPLPRIKEYFNNVILDSQRLSALLCVGTYIILGIVSLFMTIVNIYTGEKILMYATSIFTLLCFVDTILELLNKRWHNAIRILFQIQFLVLLTFFVISGIPEGFSVIWALMLPVSGMLIFGKKNNTILCSIMFCILLFFFETSLGQSFLQYEYTEQFMLRFPMAFFAFFMIAFFIETIREHLNKELERLRESQSLIIADQTSELRAQYFDILHANSQLQLRNKILRDMIGNDLSDDDIRQRISKNGNQDPLKH